MRTTIVVPAALLFALAGACQPRDDSPADSMTADSTPGDRAAANDTPPAATPPSQPDTSRANVSQVRPAGDTGRDSTLPPEDSIRAMRPKLPQVRPDSRPGRWRGFKLPEERPVQLPVETIRRVEPAPDSVTKGDSTKPPKPSR